MSSGQSRSARYKTKRDYNLTIRSFPIPDIPFHLGDGLYTLYSAYVHSRSSVCDNFDRVHSARESLCIRYKCVHTRVTHHWHTLYANAQYKWISSLGPIACALLDPLDYQVKSAEVNPNATVALSLCAGWCEERALRSSRARARPFHFECKLCNARRQCALNTIVLRESYNALPATDSRYSNSP